MIRGHKLKKVKVILEKLSAHEINEATKSKNVKPKHRVKKLKQSVKSTHAPATLRRDTIGKTPKFTFSTYKLPCKKRRNYIFHCTVSGCRKVFNSVKNWNSHHLCLHRVIKYKCNVCFKWIVTPNRFKDHKYTHQET